MTSRQILQYWKQVFHLKPSDAAPISPVPDLIQRHMKVQPAGRRLPELITTECMDHYRRLPLPQRLEFLTVLTQEFGSTHDESLRACKAYLEAQQGAAANERLLAKLEDRLVQSFTPTYIQFFRQIVHEPRGLCFLQDLRADLLRFIKQHQREGSATPSMVSLRRMSDKLKDLLTIWYSDGLLTLRQIDWQSSAQVIEYIKDHEAVHPDPSWPAWKARLQGNRRLYGFFHQTLPDEPVAFINVALMQDIPASMQTVYDEARPHLEQPPRAAIFYSISSTQPGLSGIDLGAGLIKAVVSSLQAEFPSLTAYSTLSPIPGFRPWLERKLSSLSDVNKAAVSTSLKSRDLEWAADEHTRHLLQSLCVEYLLKEKKRGRALDPVANFHLGNGAMLYRVNAAADGSSRGIAASLGFMANYKYDLDKLAERSQAYVMDGKIEVATSL